MLTNGEFSRFEVLIGCVWVPCHMEQLEAGDTFRMIDQNTEVIVENGICEWEVTNVPSVLVKDDDAVDSQLLADKYEKQGYIDIVNGNGKFVTESNRGLDKEEFQLIISALRQY